jgi:glucose-1-phosphate thymidylyltransferase
MRLKKKTKGIILSGGFGTRLFPLTIGVSKQLLPVYNKPMIYYPLSVLMLAGIRDILIITTPNDLQSYKRLLNDGSRVGLNINYKVQEYPKGLAEAFIIGRDFIAHDDVCLILGDNIFYGNTFSSKLKNCISNLKCNKATLFAYEVKDPNRYGIVEINKYGLPIKISEKPKDSKSNLAVTGLYFYPNDVLKKVLIIKPSKRDELEITSINEIYLREKRLNLEILGRGFTWLDMGTHESLLEASEFVKTIESRQGLSVACIEEIAYIKKFINKKKLNALVKSFSDTNSYNKYLRSFYEKI